MPHSSPAHLAVETPLSSSRMSRISTTLFSRKQLWIWPILAAVGLAAVAWWVQDAVEGSIKSQMKANLETILEADVTAMQIWLATQEANVVSMANEEHVRSLVERLVKQAADPDITPAQLLQASELADLRKQIQPELDAFHYNGFAVVDANGRMLASELDQSIGQTDLPIQAGLLREVLSGESLVTRPFASMFVLESSGGRRVGAPTMFAVAPVRNGEGKAIAVLGVRIPPEGEFTKILTVGRAGETGETYAFDDKGVLLSQSRFDDDLRKIGLLPDREDAHSILNLEVRDPGVDMSAGGRPATRRSEQPFTRMSESAIGGETGADVDGYRDYRGVPVIGAWTWLPQYGMGVATEVDISEAYRPLIVLRRVFWGLFALLVLSSMAIFGFTLLVSRLDRQARNAALKAQRLGQYTLDEKIGAGAMGVVYRGHHAMLRRPTAIKLLNADNVTPESVARFEREVQLTAQLNHPNTICIYDYGRTPEGVFYYAMEYLEGINLDQLVKQHGPQPEQRVVNILRQVCGSLREAHEHGLIHRDVKPANIILTQRGGMSDFVKLVDFGLVKALDGQKMATLTAPDAVAGTPMYLSPEAVQRPAEIDARADLYAVGAVGYFLLTGEHVFTGANVLEICMHQVKTTPVLPSERAGRAISPDLEALVMRCLAKHLELRPQTAGELIQQLDACTVADKWDEDDARQWWSQPDLHVNLADDSSPSTDRGNDETIVHGSS